jgi:GH18 family chitinase
MQRAGLTIIGLIILLPLLASGQSFKSVGYIPYYRTHLIDSFAFEKLTHVNIAFANPDIEGNLSFGNTDIDPIIARAHESHVEVFISLAGGALTPSWETAWAYLLLPENRDAFIQKIISYTLEHEFDGIDLDLEWSHVDEHYSGFVLALKQATSFEGLTLTAALPGTYRYPDISAEALDAFDWINMMVYDLRGPWDPDNIGPHSPISFAYSSINYWGGQGVTKDRLTLGMPFYGYDFTDQNNVHALTYAQIVNMDVANAYADQFGDIYYNGIPTIETKTQLAIDENLCGVMMWELGHDRFDQYSLLDKIYNIIQLNIVATDEIAENKIMIYPNPFINEINIEFERAAEGTIQIRDLNGRAMMSQDLLSASTAYKLRTLDLTSGIYLLSFISAESSWTQKLVKN